MTDKYSIDNPPPCLDGKKILGKNIIPDPINCHIECENTVVLGKAEGVLKNNIKFYYSLLNQSKNKLKKHVISEIEKKIKINEMHLNNIGLNKSLISHSVELTEC